MRNFKNLLKVKDPFLIFSAVLEAKRARPNTEDSPPFVAKRSRIRSPSWQNCCEVNDGAEATDSQPCDSFQVV